MQRVPAFFEPDGAVDRKEDRLIKIVRFAHTSLLKYFDPDLYTFLDKTKAPPELYMLKWVRLLFSREFEVAQVLQIWDELVKGNNINAKIGEGLVEYLCVSLLQFVRYELLNFVDLRDESGMVEALRRILHFPSVPEIQNLISQSLEMRKKYIAAHPSRPAPPLKNVAQSEGNALDLFFTDERSTQSKHKRCPSTNSESAFDFINELNGDVAKKLNANDSKTELRNCNRSQESGSAFDFFS